MVLPLDPFNSTEEQCTDYLVALRWDNGFLCPDCGDSSYWVSRTGRQGKNYFVCKNCRKKTSVTSNTVMFHHLRKPIKSFLEFVWLTVHADAPPLLDDLQSKLNLSSATGYEWKRRVDEAFNVILDRMDNTKGKFYIGRYETACRQKKCSWRSRLESAYERIYLMFGVNRWNCVIKYSFRSNEEAFNLFSELIPIGQHQYFSDKDTRSLVLEILKKNIPDPKFHISVDWKYQLSQAAIRMAYFECRDLLFHEIVKYGIAEKINS